MFLRCALATYQPEMYSEFRKIIDDVHSKRTKTPSVVVCTMLTSLKFTSDGGCNLGR